MEILKILQKIKIFRKSNHIIKISQRDIDYALRVYSELLLTCHRASDCFFRNSHKECPIDFTPYLYFPKEVYEKWIKDKRISDNEEVTPPFASCPLLELKENLIECDPGFFGEFKKFIEALCVGKTERKISYEKRVFLAFVLLAVIAFSRAAKKIPYTSKKTIEGLKEERLEKRRKFYNLTKKKLKEADPQLYKIINQELKNFKVEEPFKNSFFFLIRIFLAGLEKSHFTHFPEGEEKEIIKAVEEFLKRRN